MYIYGGVKNVVMQPGVPFFGSYKEYKNRGFSKQLIVFYMQTIVFYMPLIVFYMQTIVFYVNATDCVLFATDCGL